MASEGASGEVVSIRSRLARPDFKQLASRLVIAAREKLGEDRTGFAAYLSDLLDWRISPQVVGRWESGSMTRADVALACGAIVRNATAEILAFSPGISTEGIAALLSPAGETVTPLLDSVPNGFPPEALAGPWVTAYEFAHGAKTLHHVDVAHVTAEPDGRLNAVNNPPQPRTEGRVVPFRNEIEATLHSRHLIGQWRNTSDARYFGSVQLAVEPGENVMEGWYTGFASDVTVSFARWRWVRLDVPDSASLSRTALLDPADVYAAVMGHSFDAPIDPDGVISIEEGHV